MKMNFMAMRSLLFTGIVIWVNAVYSQVVSRVEPPFWWAGMKNEKLQIMLYGEGIGNGSVSIDSKQVKLSDIHQAESPNYLFLDVVIAKDAKPGSFDIKLKTKNGKENISYELKQRSSREITNVDASDVIYLATPDRFVNGDTSNDTVEGMKDPGNRAYRGGRHGGDLAGVASKLDYLEDLGITSLWLNPVVENDMPEHSYHGYAITDFYKVDPRYGTNEQYKQLADKLHDKGMKLVIDMVFNHCGLSHWWMEDLPYADWVHDFEKYGTTNYQLATESDPYSSRSDVEKMEKGWFVPSMPDLNQDNPMMANYLIQNSIWWVEYAGLDGIRMDTHPYNSKEVMREWTRRVKNEYPDFFLLGETWVGEVALESYWAPGAVNRNGFESGLSSITDFPLCYAIHKAFQEDGDVWQLYETLAKDFLYAQPITNTTFADNHDMDRFYHTIGNDVNRFKTAMTFLLTTRGTPQLFYGTEILMNKFGDHGDLREDFPGGWPDDQLDAFDFDQLNKDQKAAFSHLKTVLNYRKKSKPLQLGKLVHFMPNENVYVYFRSYEDDQVMVVLSNNDEEVILDLGRFSEMLDGHVEGRDILNGKKMALSENLNISPESSMIIELQ